MSDIDEMQTRLASAMGRISQALEAAQHAQGERNKLQAALEEEKAGNAKLQEHMRQLTANRAEQEGATAAARARMAELDRDLQRLRRSHDALREINAALRKANAQGMGAPDLINAALAAELEALRAARATETAELNAILSTLTPLLEEGGAQDA